MKGDCRGDADKNAYGNTAGQFTWFAPQAQKPQVVVLGCSSRLKFHWYAECKIYVLKVVVRLLEIYNFLGQIKQ
jgi:hypothetical protein